MFRKKKKNKKSGKIKRAKVKSIKKDKLKRLVRKRKKQGPGINWRKWGVVFLMVCFAMFTGWVLLFSGVLKINSIEVTNYDDGRNLVIEEFDDLKNDKFFNFIPANNLVLFSKDKFISKIKEKDLVVREVFIRKIFPDKLVVNVEKRKRMFLWRWKDGCQLFDERAGMFESMDCSNNEKELLDLCEKKRNEFNLECSVFVARDNTSDAAELESIKVALRAGQLIMEKLKKTFYFRDDTVLILPSLVSQEIRVKNKKNGEVWFSLNRDINRQLNEFRVFLEKKVNAEDLLDMQYVDLRLKNKIIYKFNEGYGNNDEL